MQAYRKDTNILDRFLQSAEVIQMTGRSFRMQGRQVDKKEDQAIVDEAENELETGQSKTGQTRAPGPPKKTTKKPAN